MLPESFLATLQKRPIEVGDLLAGRYHLIERLGHGAMGQVFVAENLAIGRQVAVKVLKGELLADQTFRQRFQQEAEAIAAIEHRNVARFLDLVVGDPTFIVMEYVRGPTLAERLKTEGRLSAERALAIGSRLCWALDLAHQTGVVHRDIKPANVILCADPESGEEPKLIDFGLAKLASSTSQSGLTRTGQIVGTPEYMSPEQISDNNQVDARSDVYSLGCLLYEMLAGRAPFSGDDVQILYQQVHQPPEPVTRYAPSTPPAVERLLAKALAKEPKARYQSMRELAVALGEAAPGAAPPPSARPRWPVAATAAIALAGLALGVPIGRWQRRAPPPPARTGILVLSRPPGAQVTLDGHKVAELTPTLVRGLSPGKHVVALERGRSHIERQVALAKDERAVVNVAMPPSSHRVELRSIPEGATLFLDGHLAGGETPTSIDVTEDDFHELRIEKAGYESLTRALTPDDHAPVITFTLEPEVRPRGTLFVDANGAAEVYVDGLDTGYTTPTLAMQVPLGSHTVEVRGSDGSASAKVTLARGQTVRLLLSPKPDGGKCR